MMKDNEAIDDDEYQPNLEGEISSNEDDDEEEENDI